MQTIQFDPTVNPFLSKVVHVNGFPLFKPSYISTSYTKVSTFDYLTAIPFGKKCFLWITYFEGHPECILILIDNKYRVMKSHRLSHRFASSFPTKCTYGTLLYGTYLPTNVKQGTNCSFLVVENIFQFGGKSTTYASWNERLSLLSSGLFEQITQSSSTQELKITMPLIDTSYDALLAKCAQVSYSIIFIHAMQLSAINKLFSTQYKHIITNQPQTKHHQKTSEDQIFILKANVLPDIYSVHIPDTMESIGFAHVPNYKTSVMLNSHFRVIKENTNLDLLEESDDEEECNHRDDPAYFLKTDIQLPFVCKFNKRFSTWTPICPKV